LTRVFLSGSRGGNLLEIRGLAGASIDDEIHQGILEGVRKHPGFKIVNSATGLIIVAAAEKQGDSSCP
jgi:ABC-type sugar transport system substrate-binding protein